MTRRARREPPLGVREVVNAAVAALVLVPTLDAAARGEPASDVAEGVFVATACMGLSYAGGVFGQFASLGGAFAYFIATKWPQSRGSRRRP